MKITPNQTPSTPGGSEPARSPATLPHPVENPAVSRQARAAVFGGLRHKLIGLSILDKRETVTPPENIPQRDKDLSTLMRTIRTAKEPPQGFSPVRPDTDLQTALGLSQLGMTAENDGFITCDNTGFPARIFQDEAGQYTLSFSGTDGFRRNDWNNSPRQALGLGSNQYTQAMTLPLNMKAVFGEDFVQTTGHWLGGGLAAAAAAVTGVKATTFNAGGLNLATVKQFLDARGERDQFDARWATVEANTTNYHVLGDLITHVQTDLDPKLLPDAVGKQVTLGAVDEKGRSHNQYSLRDYGWREQHRVDLHLAPAIMRAMGVNPRA